MTKHPECVWYPNSLGDYYKKGNKGYIPILKNQSSSISKALRGDCSIVNIKDEKCDEYICVIREPFDRYRSGISQYLKSGATFRDTYNNLSEAKFVLDKHTYPQSWFLIPFIGENIKLINTDDKSLKSVCDFLEVEYKKQEENVTDPSILRDSILICDYWKQDILTYLIQEHNFFEIFFKKSF